MPPGSGEFVLVPDTGGGTGAQLREFHTFCVKFTHQSGTNLLNSMEKRMASAMLTRSYETGRFQSDQTGMDFD